MGAPKLKEKKLKKKARKVVLKVLERVRDRRASTKGVVVVCNRCGDSKSDAGDLQNWLERQIEADPRLDGQVAVRRIGCMGPCPSKKKLSVGVGGERQRDWKRCFVVDPKKDRQRLLGLLAHQMAV